MRKMMRQHADKLLLFAIVLFAGLLIAPWVAKGKKILEYPELRDFTSKKTTQYPELSKYFIALAEKKGARYAFDLLRRAPLPLNTDIHLLGHAIGDVLYKKEGAGGMALCTNDFRNACSHSIVVGLFTSYGESALEKITEACRLAPGGKGAYTMCFHGLGHGILVYHGYDLAKAVAGCGKTGSAQYGFRESIECVGGAVMEIIGGGFHDPDTWKKQRVKYFTKDDPLAPCNRPIIPSEAKHMCYLYITSNLIKPLSDAIETITEADIAKAFEECEKIPATELQNRNYCMGGVAKEFIILVLARDFRSIEELTDRELDRWYSLCQLAKTAEGITACVRHSVNTFYWGGENAVRLPIRFCGSITDAALADVCFSHLVGAILVYAPDRSVLLAACRQLPLRYQDTCYET